MKPGGHVCLSHRTTEEKFDALAGYILGGIVRGERCLYWGTVSDFALAATHLEAHGVPVSALRQRTSLLVLDPTVLPGRQDLEARTGAIRAAAFTARAEGYTGLRIVGDPVADVRGRLTQDQLAKFERSLSSLFVEARATGLCIFDQNETDPAVLELALCTHEVAILAGRLCANPFYSLPPGSSEPRKALERVEWMAANILQAAAKRDLLESESAALILESSRVGRRDSAYRDEIAGLRRAIEARDRLIVTVARWLSRPLPSICSQLEQISKDPRMAGSHDLFEACFDHVGAMARLSHGLDEIASFVQTQVVLRLEPLDLIQVARAAVAEYNDAPSGGKVDVKMEGPDSVAGTWDRLRVTRLFYALIKTAREQGFDSYVHLRIDDLVQFVRVRIEFTLPHAPSLSDSGERMRSLAYGSTSESDYDRLAVQLWSAREIVRMMGGTLGISTWADARVIFTLDLPKSAPEQAPTG